MKCVTRNRAFINRQRPIVVDAASAVAHRYPREDDVSVNANYSAMVAAINNRGLGTRPDHLQADADGEILPVSRGRNQDGIARVGEGNGLPDGFAGGLGRLSVVVVTAVHSIDVPRVAGQGGWSETADLRCRGQYQQ